GGYGYNYVLHRHWFAGMLIDLGAGVGYSELKDQSGSTHRVGLQVNVDARLGFGYNSNKWFSGFVIIYRADRYALPYADCYLTADEGMARFIVARRLTTHKKLLAKSTDD